mgnify:CR=1 FL=1
MPSPGQVQSVLNEPSSKPLTPYPASWAWLLLAPPGAWAGYHFPLDLGLMLGPITAFALVPIIGLPAVYAMSAVACLCGLGLVWRERRITRMQPAAR